MFSVFWTQGYAGTSSLQHIQRILWSGSDNGTGTCPLHHVAVAKKVHKSDLYCIGQIIRDLYSSESSIFADVTVALIFNVQHVCIVFSIVCMYFVCISIFLSVNLNLHFRLYQTCFKLGLVSSNKIFLSSTLAPNEK